MIITELEAFQVAIPLPQPISVSNRTIAERDFVLVRIRTDEGLEGCGYGLARGGLVAESIRHHLAPVLAGQDPLATESLWQEMYGSTRYLGRKGLLMRAISAVDIALWDLKGKAAGMPLWRLLGGSSPHVPAIAAGGYYRDGTSLADVESEYAAYREQGYQEAKMMVGRLPIEADMERIAAARRGLGEWIPLMLDFGGLLPDAKAALAWVNRLSSYPIAFIEDPFMPDDTLALEQLARSSLIPIAAGEEESGRWTFRELLQRSAVDVLRHDATVAGGISEWLKIGHLALAYNKTMLPHWFPEIHIHLAAAMPSTIGVEFIPESSGVMNFHLLTNRGLCVKDGFAEAPNAAGLGIEWREEAISEYRR